MLKAQFIGSPYWGGWSSNLQKLIDRKMAVYRGIELATELKKGDSKRESLLGPAAVRTEWENRTDILRWAEWRRAGIERDRVSSEKTRAADCRKTACGEGCKGTSNSFLICRAGEHRPWERCGIFSAKISRSVRKELGKLLLYSLSGDFRITFNGVEQCAVLHRRPNMPPLFGQCNLGGSMGEKPQKGIIWPSLIEGGHAVISLTSENIYAKLWQEINYCNHSWNNHNDWSHVPAATDVKN